MHAAAEKQNTAINSRGFRLPCSRLQPRNTRRGKNAPLALPTRGPCNRAVGSGVIQAAIMDRTNKGLIQLVCTAELEMKTW